MAGDLNIAREEKMNPVVHFEMPAEDRQRMADFYKRAFGWENQRCWSRRWNK